MTIRAYGHALLIEGAEELWLIKTSLHARSRERKRNGVAVTPMVSTALQAVESALRVSHSGREDVPEPVIEEDSVTWIGTLQAAEILGCTQRHVRRIASSLDGRRVGRAWVFPSDSVQFYRDVEATHDDYSIRQAG